MVTPFSKFKSIEDIALLMDNEETLLYPLVDNTIFALDKIIDPYEDYIPSFGNNEATIAGLFIKQVKLFKDLYNAYKLGNTHLYLILYRIIYEAFIKMKYLIEHGAEAQKTYRLYSFKDRYNFYKETKDKKDGYFQVRNKKFLLDLEAEGFTLKDLENPPKSFGGKSMRLLIEKIDGKGLYNSLYAMMSDTIHSDWGEIRQMYLQMNEEENMYCLKFEEEIHGRMFVPMVQIIIDAAESYTKWAKHNEVSVALQPLLQEMNRMSSLLGEYYLYIYKTCPQKYMKE